MDFVFTWGKNNKPYSEDYMQRIYKKALAAFNAKYNMNLSIQLYPATKHSFGTQFINEHPEHEKILRDHFGHTSLKMTERYAKIRIVDAMRNIESVSKLSVGGQKD